MDLSWMIRPRALSLCLLVLRTIHGPPLWHRSRNEQLVPPCDSNPPINNGHLKILYSSALLCRAGYRFLAHLVRRSINLIHGWIGEHWTLNSMCDKGTQKFVGPSRERAGEGYRQSIVPYSFNLSLGNKWLEQFPNSYFSYLCSLLTLSPALEFLASSRPIYW